MSLGGLAIAIGMLVDAAVVVVENIVTHLRTSRAKLPHAARDLPRGAGSQPCRWPRASLIIIIVFLPLLTLQGLEGKLFAPVALTIVFALAAFAAAVADGRSRCSPPACSRRAPRRTVAGAQAAARLRPRCDWALAHSRTGGRRSRRRTVSRPAALYTADRQGLHAGDGRGRRDHAGREAALDQPGRSPSPSTSAIQQAHPRPGARGDGASWRAPAPTNWGWTRWASTRPTRSWCSSRASEWRKPDKEWLIDEMRR